ncbi:MAG: carbamoyl phosphate synthase small subunit [Legionellales bacterium RIFCSPHIGHO2_12_FULL_35_11]|nr:MAG: carbamoyl phosphate synthase small subunit [Legionellales bacterium RIFCSPHIGHO2_12_FULL_35_11]
MQNESAILALADGTVFHGKSIGASGDGVGELVFNTAMTGYQEMLTDPSYAEQIITLTAAHVGNTGCNPEDNESTKIWAKGLVIREYANLASNYRKTESLSNFLKRNNTVAISDIDTRALTHKLRDFGSINSCISTNIENTDHCIQLAKNFSGLDGADLAVKVSREVIECWHEGLGEWGYNSKPLQFHVVVYDFGVKNSILKILYDLGCHITIVPAKTPSKEVLQMQPDGIFLSNGPGDPKACDYAITTTREFLNANIPILGVCLGFQILALACGAKSVKMKFGHHGANHPVVSTDMLRKVFITSQNHGFTIDEKTLPDDLIISHRSLFDNSLQGIIHRHRPALGFQGHPEASPGPHDIEVIFNQFINLMTEYKYSE